MGFEVEPFKWGLSLLMAYAGETRTAFCHCQAATKVGPYI